jgi:hypothetical protein
MPLQLAPDATETTSLPSDEKSGSEYKLQAVSANRLDSARYNVNVILLLTKSSLKVKLPCV